MLAIVKRRNSYSNRGKIRTLLTQLGVVLPKSPRSLWSLSKDELGLIFFDAKEQYQKRRIALAPRHLEDDWVEAAKLNQLWNIIVARFENKLHPQLMRKFGIVRQKLVRTYKPVGHGQAKTCQHYRCRKVFRTVYAFQKYCSRKCQDRAATRRKRLKSGRIFREFFRTCKNPSCGKAFRTNRSRKIYHSKRCQKAVHIRRWQHKNPDKVKARRERYLQRHPNALKEIQKRYIMKLKRENPEKLRQRWRNRKRNRSITRLSPEAQEALRAKWREKANKRRELLLKTNPEAFIQKEKLRHQRYYQKIKTSRPDKYQEILERQARCRRDKKAAVCELVSA